MVLAIAILGLVAACIVSLVAFASGEFKYTQLERQKIQLQQYHLAAIAIAQDELKYAKPVSGTIELPEWAPSASIQWNKIDNSSANCDITIASTTWSHQFDRTDAGFVLAK